jgi:hypothetical protein
MLIVYYDLWLVNQWACFLELLSLVAVYLAQTLQNLGHFEVLSLLDHY